MQNIGYSLWISFYYQTFSNEMSVVTKAIKFINTRGLYKQKFKQLLKEIECQYTGILTLYNVWWLNPVFSRFVNLLADIKLFLKEKNNSYDKFLKKDWSNDLIFLCDFTQHFNELN